MNNCTFLDILSKKLENLQNFDKNWLLETDLAFFVSHSRNNDYVKF